MSHYVSCDGDRHGESHHVAENNRDESCVPSLRNGRGVHRSAPFAWWLGTWDFMLPRWEPQGPGDLAGTAHRELVYTDGSL